jgi:hypothetical protein
MEAGTMPDKAMISHRGEKYEIGRGKRFYGIWVVGAPYEAPVDRWPESRDGWQQAWARFAALETPGTITAVDQGRTRPRLRLGRGGAGLAGAAGGSAAGGSAAVIGDSETVGDPADAAAASGATAAGRRLTALLAGEGLLVLGVVLGLVGLFPAYVGSQSLLSQGDQVVPHLLYVVAWAVSAGVIALGVARPGMAYRGAERAAALFALGLSTVTFGLFLADLGEVISGGASLGTGLVVSLLGWLACTAGAGIALHAACHDDEPGMAWPAAVPSAALRGPGAAPYPQTGEPRRWHGLARPSRRHAGPLALLVLAAIGTAAAFAPSWDSYTLVASGTAQTITRGNAFDDPGLVIAGNVAVMVAVVAIAALAALWRPARQGALLIAGAIVPLAAQAVSALIQVSHPATDAMFGISGAEASAIGLTISSGVTPIFWVYCAFVISLLISCAWLFTEPRHPAMPAMRGTQTGPLPPIPGGDPVPGAVVDESVNAGDDSDGEPVRDGADSDGGTEGNEHSAYA